MPAKKNVDIIQGYDKHKNNSARLYLDLKYIKVCLHAYRVRFVFCMGMRITADATIPLRLITAIFDATNLRVLIQLHTPKYESTLRHIC